MTKMSVYFIQTMSAVVDVDADSPAEAIEKAAQEVSFQPCHQCNDSFEEDGDFEALYVSDADGEHIWAADEGPWEWGCGSALDDVFGFSEEIAREGAKTTGTLRKRRPAGPWIEVPR